MKMDYLRNKIVILWEIHIVIMDLQTRKLNVIEYLIGIDDEKFFSEIETAVFKNTKAVTFRPFTKEELIIRAQQANNDYSSGKITTQEELEAESEKW